MRASAQASARAHSGPPGPAFEPEALCSLVDADAVATQLGVPKSWVLAEARADRIPHCRLGRYVRFDPVAIDEWWRARVRGPWRARGAAAGVAKDRAA